MNKENLKVVDWLLDNNKTLADDEINSIADWQRLLKPKLSTWQAEIDKAIVAGFLSDRLGYAFLSGYEHALQKHFKILPRQSLAAFCVSEKGGSRPKAMKTFLAGRGGEEGYLLNGQKSFVTCAEDAEWLLIAAALELQMNHGVDSRVGEHTGERPEIKLALVKADAPGLSVTSSPELPFIPEIKKGSLTLKNVLVSEENVLCGDGYSDYVKPFSCVEGVYIAAATAAHLFRLACLFDWPHDLQAQTLSTLLGLKQLEQGDMCSPAAEIMVSGLKAQLKQITEASKPLWTRMPLPHQQRLGRDCGMLLMTDKAHLTRLERAWQRYSGKVLNSA